VKSQENRVVITGHLAADPKLAPTDAGRPVCDLRLTAHNGRHPRFDIPVSVFDEPARACGAHLAKGDEVRVEGELRFRRWRDRGGRWHQDFSIAGQVELLQDPHRRGDAAADRQVRAAASVMRTPTETERRRLIRARARLRSSVPINTYKLWIRPLRLCAVTADAVHLLAPEHLLAWSERRYSSLIVAAIRDEGLPARVSFAALQMPDHVGASGPPRRQTASSTT
jgi:single-stranded DNA-binding protein